MADCSTIKARLDRAQATYENWVNGEYVSSFTDQNGERVTYSSGGMSRLTALIAKLEGDLAACQGATPAYRGPLKFVFGRRPF